MDAVLSVVMLAALGLFAGAFWLWRRQGMIKQVWLMIVAALIMLLNVGIWTIPDKGGTAPADRAAVPPE